MYMLKKVSQCLELIVKEWETKTIYMSYSFFLQNVLVENTQACI